ncbi:DUF3013 family protein [Vagococcus silagei]|uniref:DUF3013 family protein n=1 Tax=Vagococcus silagei TaxID=2508885 RepID=A0A4S3B746_9ENTE|nr:DUF3013 family protein [Vagococcus silagei]THB60505.1 DUF3013 family protein [Vagococcus silagei]
MKKENMLTYLESAIEKNVADIDFAMDWNKRNHTVEIILAFYAENKSQEAIEDGEGIVSEEEIIEFQDGILFFVEGHETEFDAEDYLTMISFDKKRGLSKEFIDIFASYLGEVVVQGEDDLLDFLTDETQEFFELHWDEEAFAAKVANIEATISYPYPSY